MFRTNTPADVANTGRVRIDTGGGVSMEVSVAPVPDLATRLAALEYDTGWITVAPDAGVTGTIKVKRTASGGGDRTTLRLEGVLPPAGAGSAFLATLPTGFWHSGEHYFIADGRSATLPSEIGLYNGSRVAFMQLMSGVTTRPTDPLSGEYTWESVGERPTI